ncbi:MAG TPA: hypothetical protein VI306_25460 [Pyrinomonadaceae bacterium]
MKIENPVTRPLKAYAFDPSAGRLLGNEMSMAVRFQELDPGPVVRDRWAPNAIAIVDYNGATKQYYKPVDLDDRGILLRGGLSPSEADPYFHQQMVYAVITNTIQHFEEALGRRIHWRRGVREGDLEAAAREDIYTLNIYPHAFVGRNAFYSPRAHGILFGYFRAGTKDVGRNLPGQPVFTCLSHDVVVHETTHAIVDGIRSFFTEQTNPDVSAFHEAFADLAALFQHFTYEEALLDTMERTGGKLYQYQLRPDAEMAGYDDYASATPEQKHDPLLSAQISARNPLIEIAQQFGEATGKNRALRSALGTKPNSLDILKLTEPHARGSILVAAVFDAYFAIYLKRTADLWRIFRAGGGSANPVDIPRPLAMRLCDEARALSRLFFRLCVRALDYCAPVDITFGSYLRSIVTADFDLHPEDEIGIREAVKQSFRLRGIMPENAGFFSDDSIRWPRAPEDLPPVVGLNFGDPNGLTMAQKKEAAAILQAYVTTNCELLGFSAGVPVVVPSFHPVFRINSDGSLRIDMVVEAVQTIEKDFNPAAPKFGKIKFRGGATLIISKPMPGEPSALKNESQIRYVISKKLSPQREERQRRFGEHLGLDGTSDQNRFEINFSMLHGGI